MTAGRVVLYIQFPRSSAGEGVLSSRGVALISCMAMCGIVPSISHLVRIFLMVYLPLYESMALILYPRPCTYGMTICPILGLPPGVAGCLPDIG